MQLWKNFSTLTSYSSRRETNASAQGGQFSFKIRIPNFVLYQYRWLFGPAKLECGCTSACGWISGAQPDSRGQHTSVVWTNAAQGLLGNDLPDLYGNLSSPGSVEWLAALVWLMHLWSDLRLWEKPDMYLNQMCLFLWCCHKYSFQGCWVKAALNKT